MSYATNGVPTAIASLSTRGKPSNDELKTAAEALAKTSIDRLVNPGNCTRSVMPRFLTSPLSALACDPVP